MLNKFLGKVFLSFVFFLLGVTFTYPLILNINTKIPNGYIEYKGSIVWGDHLQLFANSKEHVNTIKAVLNNKPIYNKEFCQTDIKLCKTSVPQNIKKIVFSPFWISTLLNILFDDITSFNLYIFINFVITGLSGYYLAKEFIKDKFKENIKIFNKRFCIDFSNLIAFLSSGFLLFSAKRLIHLFGGQKIGYLTFVPALIMLFTEKLIRHKKNPDYKRMNFVNKHKYQIIISICIIYLSVNEQFLMFYSIAYIVGRVVWNVIFEKIWLKKLFLTKFLNTIISNLWIPIVIITSYLINLAFKLNKISTSNISEGRPIEYIQMNSGTISNLWSGKILGFENNVYIGMGLLFILLALIYSIFIFLKNRKVASLLFYILFVLLIITISLGINTPLYVFLYENVPTFKFSRTPTHAMLIVYPIIIIFASIIISNIYKQINRYKINFFLKLTVFMVVIVVSIYGWHSKYKISLTTVPRYENEIISEGKILFLPMTVPDDPLGSLAEFYLSNGDFISVNGYDPFYSKSEKDFIQTYGKKMNFGKMTPEELEDFLDEFEIKQIVVLKRYFNHSTLEWPRTSNLQNNLPRTLDMLDNSGVVYKSHTNGDVETYEIL